MARRDERGFTLVELIIALAIVGALLAVAFGGLRVALAAWRQGEDRAEAHQHVRGVALMLARALEGTYPYTGARGEAPEAELLFEGRPQSLQLVTRSAPFPFTAPIAFTAVVIERTEGEQGGLVVRQRPLPNRNPFTDAAVVLQDPSVTSLAFSYLDEAGTWSDTWEPPDQTLPRAIRITLGAQVNGRAETLPPLTVSLRIAGP
jgi:general secretion pathway protein J